jgi:hypothetical protein
LSVNLHVLPILWAHYAGNHSGACLVLDKESFTRRVEAESSGYFGDPSGVVHRRVQYDADSFAGDLVADLVDADVFRHQGYDAAALDYLSRRDYKSLFQKHSDWSVEQEYRYTYLDPIQRDSIDINIEDCVVGLILGMSYTDSHLPSAREFDRRLGADGCVVKCFWNRTLWGPQVIGEVNGDWECEPYPRQIWSIGTMTAVAVQSPPEVKEPVEN